MLIQIVNRYRELVDSGIIEHNLICCRWDKDHFIYPGFEDNHITLSCAGWGCKIWLGQDTYNKIVEEVNRVGR